MPWTCCLRATITTILIGGLLSACTSGDAGEQGDPTPVEPTAPAEPPTDEALLDAAVDVIEALEAEYPGLRIHVHDTYDSVEPGDLREDLFEQHGFAVGTIIRASDDTFQEVLLVLNVFESSDGARGYRDGYEQEFHLHRVVVVPGWPGGANLQDRGSAAQSIEYHFVHDRASLRLQLWTEEYESAAAAGVELATALDITQATLDETVPTPESEEPDERATPSPTKEPTAEQLLAAAATAVEAQRASYPRLRVASANRYYPSTHLGQHRLEELYEKHGFVSGIRVQAATDTNPGRIHIRLDAFGSDDDARGYQDDYEERFLSEERVEVPGWPDGAELRGLPGDQHLTYIFVHGPAVVMVQLLAIDSESETEAVAEFATALDITQATLDETVPIPE